MKILILSWYFPPSNTIAAVRIGKLAKHLLKFGHEVKVLTVSEPPHPQTLPVDIESEYIIRVPWRDVNALPRRVGKVIRRKEKKEAIALNTYLSKGTSTLGSASSRQENQKSLKQQLSQLYQHAFNFPDDRVGWVPTARRRGIELVKEQCPDCIFASGPPFSTLLAGHLISKATAVPLVVEFRDRWAEDPYYPPPLWRAFLDRALEAIIVKHAVALTTVSAPWADTFRARYGKPVAVIHNGYDEEDFAGKIGRGWPDPDRLRIVYTGGIYPGYRDPSPLFAAIGRLGDLKSRVDAHFYGSDERLLSALAIENGVKGNVKIHSHVNHAEALKIQRQADVLLLMQWDDPREQGNIPGKFAEYLGARRPILVLGYSNGVPATVVRERSAGAASTDPVLLAEQLKVWLNTKREKGCLPPLCDAAVTGFSREEQAKKLSNFLEEVLVRH